MKASEINVENFEQALADARRRCEALQPLADHSLQGYGTSARLNHTLRTALDSLERIQRACARRPLPLEVDRWPLFTRFQVDGDAEALPDEGLAENIVRIEYVFRRL